MTDGVYDLDDSYQFFYLCGVGFKERHNTNVHLAVRPKTGSVAAIGSAYGVRFTVWDAQAIPIKHPMLLESPPLGLESLEKDHIGCKNFQFGCQVFEVDVVGEGAEGIMVTTPRTVRHFVPTTTEEQTKHPCRTHTPRESPSSPEDVSGISALRAKAEMHEWKFRPKEAARLLKAGTLGQVLDSRTETTWYALWDGMPAEVGVVGASVLDVGQCKGQLVFG